MERIGNDWLLQKEVVDARRTTKVNYFEAEEKLMKDLQVSVRHPFSPVRDEVLLRDCIKASEEGRIPDREAKRIWVEEWEESIKYDCPHLKGKSWTLTCFNRLDVFCPSRFRGGHLSCPPAGEFSYVGRNGYGEPWRSVGTNVCRAG